MKTSDFDFELPEELIAQTPLERRDASRLLTLDKYTGETGHHPFYELCFQRRKRSVFAGWLKDAESFSQPVS